MLADLSIWLLGLGTMTFGLKNLAGALALRKGDTEKRRGFFGTRQALFGSAWSDWKICPGLIESESWTADDLWTYTLGAHANHALDFSAALLCYWLFFSTGAWLTECQDWRIGWVSRVVLFNLACEVLLCNFWHYFIYVSGVYNAFVTAGLKYNPTNQYEPQSGEAGMMTSATGQLEREITFTTLGWLQSAAWQCVFMKLWASGVLPVYSDFWAFPIYSLFVLWLVAYWRELHFYCLLTSCRIGNYGTRLELDMVICRQLVIAS